MNIILRYFLIMVAAILLLVDSVHSAESYNVRFSWNNVTENETPCTDLAGYAIYRSRIDVDSKWLFETYEQKAFKIVTADVLTTSVTCTDDGIWYWIIRAFDTSGNYSFRSNVLKTDFDTTIPGSVMEFKIISGGTF